jgi:ABC-type multidrug transport system fused ATPase/permease subunit
MYLDSTPFIFTGTILDNINPFPDRGIDNRKVIEALMKVKLWDNI